MLASLHDWNPWWSDKEAIQTLMGKEVEVLHELVRFLEVREIKVLTGVRRSGKSTLFYQLIDHLIKTGVPPERILLINFDDDILSKATLRELFDIYQTNIFCGKGTYLFIDEAHRCREWALFVRKLYDTRQVEQVFITDSASSFIPKEYAQVFTGRNVKYVHRPLSFRAYVEWNGASTNPEMMSSFDENRLQSLLKDYMEYGGFPEVFFKEPSWKKIILKEYFDDILYKDIIDRFGIDLDKARDFALFLMSNNTSPFSVRRYSREHGLSLQSVEKYITLFEEVFLFFPVARFDFSLRSQQVSQKKVYAIDHGLANVSGFRFSENKGKVAENIVFIELMRRLSSLGKIFYWKDPKRHREIDFLVQHGLKPAELIQVCWDPSEPSTRTRETEALSLGLKTFDLNEGVVITQKYEGEETVEDRRIRYIPLWKWLLSTKGNAPEE